MRHVQRSARVLAVIAIVGALALPLTGGYAATVAVRVDSVEAEAGKEKDIPVAVRGAPGIGAMHVELTYDPAVLEFVAVNKGELLGDDALMDSVMPEPGRVI